MSRKHLLWYALIGGGVYYLWSKSRPAPAPVVATPATTTVAGLGHMHPAWGSGYGGMANVYARGRW